MSPAFVSLNPAQAEAVNHIDGPVLIFAGAGSGKTRVITHRIKKMIESGVSSSCIVAVTFTNKSAREMKERLSKMLPSKYTRKTIISTFHSLGNRILQKEIELLGYRRPFSILDSDESLQIFSNIYRTLKLDPDDIKKDGTPFLVSLCKNSGRHVEDWSAGRGLPMDAKLFCDIYERYQKQIRALNAVDFDDLILLPSQIFKLFPEVLERYNRRYRYFMIDEFQDTNRSQYEFLLQLTGNSRNLCVVGDDDQSIYGWRGADVSIIRNFESDFPDAKIVRLEENYRSTRVILEAANAVIQNNSERVSKQLIPTGEEGTRIKLSTAADEELEGAMVAEMIQDAILRERKLPGDFAILYRTNFQSRVFEQELRKREIPHYVVGGYRFFDRREVKDLIAYLRVIANPSDEISVLRIINRPKRNLGETTIQKIGEYIQQNSDVENHIHFYDVLQMIQSNPGFISEIPAKQAAGISEFVDLIEDYRKQFSKARRLSVIVAQLVKELDFEKEFMREGNDENAVRAKTLNLSELVNMVSFMEDNWEESEPPTLFDFLSRISLQASDQDDAGPRGRVQLLTLHLSKGLEFPHVFLTGMADGIFPAERSLSESVSQSAALEEERRLCYVGITRAMKQLTLTYSEVRRRFGEEIHLEPSRFLEEIPDSLIEVIDYECKSPPDSHADLLTALENALI